MLRADVPVGSYLSGGLDSSLVAALGRRVKGEQFCTYSIRFEDAEYDETPFQRTMVAAIGSEHREITGASRRHRRGLPRGRAPRGAAAAADGAGAALPAVDGSSASPASRSS